MPQCRFESGNSLRLFLTAFLLSLRPVIQENSNFIYVIAVFEYQFYQFFFLANAIVEAHS